MSNVILSPNMSIPMPIPGVDPGPDYANNQNAGFLKIDSHNHTAGMGVQIPPAGLNINSALTFQNNPATNLSYVSMQANASASTVDQSFSSALASGIYEAWYTDSNGVATQITKNGVINATATSIPGESYASGTFTWVQGSGSNTPANFDIGSIILRPNTALTTNGIELSPPSGISSFYDIVLPALPGSTLFLTMDSSGNMGTASSISASQIAAASIIGSQIAAGTITGSNIASATVTRQNLVALGQQVSSSCGNYALTGTASLQDVTNLSVTITTTGRPVMLRLQSDTTGAYALVQIAAANTTDVLRLQFVRGASTIVNANYLRSAVASGVTSIPATCYSAMDIVGAGTYTYKVQVGISNNADTATLQDIVLIAYEM